MTRRPIACTLRDEDVPDRVELLERLRSALARVERTDGGLRLVFACEPSVEEEVRRFVRDEHRCCAFWDFEVATGEALVLRWGGPPETAAWLDELDRWFRREGPLPAIL